jgi:hypothetical protein
MGLLKRLLYALVGVGIIPILAHAAPDSTLSITPAAVSGTTITAADENDRNNDIVTWANSHDHNDIDQTANTLNIGDGTAGDKTITGNAADSPDRSLKWDDTDDQWEIQQNSTTYQAILVASGTIDLTNNGVVVGRGDLSVDTISPGTSGQVLVSAGSGSQPAFQTIGGTPALVFSSSASAGTATTYVRTDDTIALFDSTVPSNPGVAATGSGGQASRDDHVHRPSATQWFEELGITTSSVDTTFAGNAMTLNAADSNTTVLPIYRPAGANTMDVWIMADTVNAGGNAQYAISFNNGSTCYPDCTTGTEATDNTLTQIVTAADVSGESSGKLDLYVFGQNDSGSDAIEIEYLLVVFR